MLKIRHLLLAGCALLALTPLVAGGPAFAGRDNDAPTSVLWAKHGWWNIRLYQDGTCYAAADYEYGQKIVISVDGKDKYGVILMSPGVSDLRPVDGFTIRAKFDNGARYEGKADVALIDNDPNRRMMMFPVGGEMLGSFMEANNMWIYALTKQSGWKVVASMNLTGSWAATLKTVECTAQNGGHYNKPNQSSPNPFNSTTYSE